MTWRSLAGSDGIRVRAPHLLHDGRVEVVLHMPLDLARCASGKRSEGADPAFASSGQGALSHCCAFREEWIRLEVATGSPELLVCAFAQSALAALDLRNTVNERVENKLKAPEDALLE